jgi:DNA polymerase III subunit delta
MTTTNDLLKEIKQRKFAPVYLLHGDEPFYIDKIQEAIEEKALPEHEKSFNQFVLYGKDVNVPTVLSYAKRFPMMSEKTVVIVKEAQDMQGLDTKDTARFLEEYCQNPLNSTILVLCYKKNLEGSKPWAKAAGQKGIVFQSKKMYDNQLPDWILNYCHDSGTKISPKAIQMLVEFVGNDLKRLASELEKIVLNLPIGQEVTAATIEKYVGVSKEYNYFEYQKALIVRDVLKANKIAQYFSSNTKENPLPPMLILLYNFFSKVLVVHATPDKTDKNIAATLGVNPYFAKDYTLAIRNYPLGKVVQIIKDIRMTDLKSKGVEAGSISESDLLKELTFRILH